MKLVWVRSSKFNESPSDSDEILRFISKTTTGRALVEKIKPHLKSRRIQIKAYPKEITQKLAATRSAHEPAGASFIHDGTIGTIYFDPTSDLAVLSVFLVHEIAHALDENLWKAKRENLAHVQFESECLAFQAQHEYLAELTRTNPEIITYLQGKYPGATVLHELIDREQIAELYGFAA